jgi:class III poly(R)-hydroxyalkanoic acid synthase PhaE subunit
MRARISGVAIVADFAAGKDWRKDWDALGKQYWEAWTEGARAATKGDPSMLHEGFEQWSRLFAPKGESQPDVVERMLSGTRQFMSMVQGAMPGVAAAKDGLGGFSAKAFTDSLTQAMGGASLLNNPALQAIRASVGEGAMGFEQLAAQMASAAGPIRQEVGALLALPTFGYAREHQERLKELASANVAYDEQLAKYNAQMLKASQKGMEKLETKLAERSEPGRQLQTLRQVYDLWIDAAEEGYAEIALSPDFRRVYGDLVNSQMRVRKLIQDEIERIAISFGMPSRTELNSVHKRMAEMRRRMASLEEALARAEEAAQPRATGGRSPEPAASAAPKAKAQPRKAVKTGGFASKLAASRSKSRKKGGR